MSTENEEVLFSYDGPAYFRPCYRGVVLKGGEYLDEVLPSGYYVAEIRFYPAKGGEHGEIYGQREEAAP